MAILQTCVQGIAAAVHRSTLCRFGFQGTSTEMQELRQQDGHLDNEEGHELVSTGLHSLSTLIFSDVPEAAAFWHQILKNGHLRIEIISTKVANIFKRLKPNSASYGLTQLERV